MISFRLMLIISSLMGSLLEGSLVVEWSKPWKVKRDYQSFFESGHLRPLKTRNKFFTINRQIENKSTLFETTSSLLESKTTTFIPSSSKEAVLRVWDESFGDYFESESVPSLHSQSEFSSSVPSGSYVPNPMEKEGKKGEKIIKNEDIQEIGPMGESRLQEKKLENPGSKNETMEMKSKEVEIVCVPKSKEAEKIVLCKPMRFSKEFPFDSVDVMVVPEELLNLSKKLPRTTNLTSYALLEMEPHVKFGKSQPDSSDLAELRSSVVHMIKEAIVKGFTRGEDAYRENPFPSPNYNHLPPIHFNYPSRFIPHRQPFNGAYHILKSQPPPRTFLRPPIPLPWIPPFPSFPALSPWLV